MLLLDTFQGTSSLIDGSLCDSGHKRSVSITPPGDYTITTVNYGRVSRSGVLSGEVVAGDNWRVEVYFNCDDGLQNGLLLQLDTAGDCLLRKVVDGVPENLTALDPFTGDIAGFTIRVADGKVNVAVFQANGDIRRASIAAIPLGIYADQCVIGWKAYNNGENAAKVTRLQMSA